MLSWHQGLVAISVKNTGGGFRGGRSGSAPPLWATDWRSHSLSC